MPKSNRVFGRRQRQDEPSGSDGRDVPVNEHVLESAVAMLDGLGWTVYELWLQTEGNPDKYDRMQFLKEWRNLRRVLTLNRPCEFNFYGVAHESHTDIRHIFHDSIESLLRDRSALGASEHERSMASYGAAQNGYEEFLAAYDPDEDPYWNVQKGGT